MEHADGERRECRRLPWGNISEKRKDGVVSPNRRNVTQARVNPATMASRSSGGLLPWKA